MLLGFVVTENPLGICLCTGKTRVRQGPVVFLLDFSAREWSVGFVDKDNVAFGSMIHFCTCTGRSSSFEIGRNSKVSLPCESCGGGTVDGRLALPGSMLNTVGLELTRVIDPDLTWRTVANRKGRRARTSLIATNKKAPNFQSLRNSGDLIDKSSKEVEDMPISESEKLGVTILGRRFSDTLENLPIKKRKFMLVQFPSTPSQTSSSLSEDSAGSTKISNFEQLDMVDGKTNLEAESEKVGGDTEAESENLGGDTKDENEKVGGDADFSGISILATAACNCNRGGGMGNTDNSEGFPRIPHIIESKPDEISDKKPEDCSGLSSDKSDLKGCADLVEKPVHLEIRKDFKQETGTLGMLDSSSSRDDRSHWDLNTVMDEWDSLEDHEDKLENKENVEFRVTDSLSTAQEMPLVMVTETLKPMTIEDELKLETQQSDTSASSQGKHLSGKVEDILNGDRALAEATGALHNHENGGVNAEAIPAYVSVCELVENYSAFKSLNSDMMNKGQNMEKDANIIPGNNISEPSSTVVFEDKNNFAQEKSSGNTINDEQREKTPVSMRHVSIVVGLEKGSNKDSDSLIPEPATGKVSCSDVDLLKNGEASSYTQSCDPSSFLGSFDSGRLHMASPCVGEGETVAAVSKTSRAASLGSQIDAGALLGNPACKTTIVGTLTSGFKSSETCKSDGDLPKSVLVADTDPDESDYFSDISQNDGDHAMGLEKGALPLGADEESQYEDGEFRELTIQNWGDVGDEGEAEQVDYGSDNRDMDIFEAPADYGVSSSLQAEGDEAVAKEIPVDQPNLPSSSRTIQLETQSVKTTKTVKVVKKVLKANFEKKEGSDSIGTTIKRGNETRVEDEVGAEHGGCRASIHTVNARTKSTGWDQLPDVHKSSEEAHEDTSSVVGVRSSLCMEVSSRVEGTRSSDTLLLKDNEYALGGRSNDHEVSNSRLETSASPHKSIGRGGSSMHARGRGRGSDQWLDSPGNHWVPKHRRSPGYYGPSDFGPNGPKNNAAAAAAKLESSGFVVALDGTIVKAGGMGTGRGNRQSTNTSSQGIRRRGSATDREGGWNFGKNIEFGASREMSPDRNVSVGRGRPAGYNGTRVVNTSHRERYNGPVPDESFDMQHPLTHREGSFSPIHRRPLHLSHSRTKSRSRSRSRSPHIWASSRGRRSCGRATGASGFQRHSRSPSFWSEARIGGRSPHRRNSRSPNFWSEDRIERMRSPQWRPGFSEHIGFVPASRSQKSPPRASRWMDDRKDAPDHFREQGYKRSSVSERSPPARIFSRNQRFHVMGSPGRIKPDEYYRPIHSGKYSEFVEADRGPRHEGGDEDRRKHSDRYGVVHHIRHHDVEGDVKRFRYEFDNGFRAHNPHTKSGPDFHGRGSPRDYGRGIENRLGDGTRREREEKHQFRYSREGKHRSSFSTYVVRECEEDLALRRRRPS